MLSLYVQQAVSDVRSVKSSVHFLKQQLLLQNNVAKIDYDRCVNCGKCAAKCPTKVIQFEPRKPKVAPKAAPKVEKTSGRTVGN